MLSNSNSCRYTSLTQRALAAGIDSTPQMILELYYFVAIALLLPFMLYRQVGAVQVESSLPYP